MGEVIPIREDIRLYQELLAKHRYDFCKLVFIIFPFGQKGHELEHELPYDWQMEEWARMSKHLQNPLTRYKPYKLNISSGNGAAKTSFMCMTMMMLMFTQRVRGRITANTQGQMRTVTWPELEVWYRRARYAEEFFDKQGETLKARDEKLAEVWRIDAVTWSESEPVRMSGLHNKGFCVFLGFDEAAGIPEVIWRYANGAMTDIGTIKIWIAVGNSDDPESKFEQNMLDPGWFTRRIDTRECKHVDKGFIEDLLRQCGGNEDHDDFRVRVRGLPRKSAADAIISAVLVEAALKRVISREGRARIAHLPVILTCDPAWQGGDETVIWFRQGNYACMLEKYKLSKQRGEDHRYTYSKLCKWEQELKADFVWIDQGEGTGIISLARGAGKHNWELISFAASANDAPDFERSEYQNMRAQLYYEAAKWLAEEAILDSVNPEWREELAKQLCWTKAERNARTLKKQAEAKDKINARVGKSPDISDGFVISFARKVYDRLPENTPSGSYDVDMESNKMPDYDPYADIEAQFRRVA